MIEEINKPIIIFYDEKSILELKMFGAFSSSIMEKILKLSGI